MRLYYCTYPRRRTVRVIAQTRGRALSLLKKLNPSTNLDLWSAVEFDCIMDEYHPKPRKK